MSIKKIAALLEQALLHDGQMAQALFEFEFEAEDLAELKASLKADGDDYLFAVTENTGDIAMILIEKSGAVLANEEARAKLKEHWKTNYATNIRMLIPAFAAQLAAGELPINGVKTAR